MEGYPNAVHVHTELLFCIRHSTRYSFVGDTNLSKWSEDSDRKITQYHNLIMCEGQLGGEQGKEKKH